MNEDASEFLILPLSLKIPCSSNRVDNCLVCWIFQLLCCLKKHLFPLRRILFAVFFIHTVSAFAISFVLSSPWSSVFFFVALTGISISPLFLTNFKDLKNRVIYGHKFGILIFNLFQRLVMISFVVIDFWVVSRNLNLGTNDCQSRTYYFRNSVLFLRQLH